MISTLFVKRVPFKLFCETCVLGSKAYCLRTGATVVLKMVQLHDEFSFILSLSTDVSTCLLYNIRSVLSVNSESLEAQNVNLEMADELVEASKERKTKTALIDSM